MSLRFVDLDALRANTMKIKMLERADIPKLKAAN